MGKLKSATLVFIMSFTLLYVAQATELEVASSNQIELSSDGWMKPTSGDPYLVFNSNGIPIEQAQYLKITFQAKHVRNRYSYVELFTVTETHGFSEEMKGFYIQPFNVKSEEPYTTILNLSEFMTVMGETGKILQLVRVDLDPVLSEQDFKFKCSLEIIQALPQKSQNIDRVSIHPPYLSRHVMDPKISSYVISCLVRDFFHKFTRDWLFLIIYLPLIVSIAFGIRFLRKKVKHSSTS